ncbi:MAG TPA: threonine ammonia-lyase [Thermodesulfobacteriota bacterium]|jgi:threonine dehydratase
MVTLEDIEEADKILEHVILRTPLVYSYSLSELSGANVYLKLENLQRTGSFKIRGAYNKLYKLKDITKEVVAASAGNHAQGVALAAKLLGMKSTLVMPEGTAINKMLAVKNHGGEIVLFGDTFDDAFGYARKLERETGKVFIHPFDDPEVIAGQGTVGLEIIDSFKNVESVIVPVGGGGLIAGVAIAVKKMNPNIRVFGVQSKGAPSMFLSMKKKRIVETGSTQTIADGIAIKRIGEITFEIAQKYVDEVLTVDENGIEESLLLLTERKRIVVEGAGAVGLAGLLKRKKDFCKKNVAIIISGGNIDINLLARIIQRGLLKNGRLLRLELGLPDVPGSLGTLTTLLGEAKANIVEIYHDRYSKDLPIGEAIVEICLETRSFEHQEEILKLLKGKGYSPIKKD